MRYLVVLPHNSDNIQVFLTISRAICLETRDNWAVAVTSTSQR